LSIAIVSGGLYFTTAKTPVSQKLVDVGGVAMSADQFIDHVKQNHEDTYWLGPISLYEYTLNHEVAGVADVIYWPKGSDESNTNLFLYEVRTYKNRKVWDAHRHPLLATANTTTIKINSSLSIKINRASMKGEIATFGGKSEIVGIAYPAAQTLQTMLKNAKSLIPVQ
jgi:hypothetical protein